MKVDKFIDGCHRYGWLINIILTAVMFAYFLGGVNQNITDLRHEVDFLKQEVFDLSHLTRGIVEPSKGK